MKQPHSHERGFALLATGVCGVVIFGMAGLAIDLGRMYITKNEVQTYADAASLSAARLLDRTSAGLTAADSSVTNNPNKWNFGTSAFTGTNTQYSIDGSTGWAGSG